ncbi:transmembrane protein 89 [Dromiciops gliroides]|uniref:transmembrane protein 89 n=1 Tax=Dromiciops gliroides TaxID=33562 RepID=UPI001CC52399|nr:transmembrane protein 89 [Dromiciops gliroides]
MEQARFVLASCAPPNQIIRSLELKDTFEMKSSSGLNVSIRLWKWPLLVMGPGPLYLLLFLLLTLRLPPQSQALSRPVWYQVGLDLQPWGCPPPVLVGCSGGLACPHRWMGLSTMGSVYPLTAFTVTVLIVATHLVYQRHQIFFSRMLTTRTQSIVPPELLLPPSSGSPLSDRALLYNVLHMLDALLNYIEGQLQQLAKHSPSSTSAS